MDSADKERERDKAIWPYFIGPLWFAFVWAIDDALGAWLSCVGMLLMSLWFAYEVGRKKRLSDAS